MSISLAFVVMYLAGYISGRRWSHTPTGTGSIPVPATIAAVAQTVERELEALRVGGSIPSGGTIYVIGGLV